MERTCVAGISSVTWPSLGATLEVVGVDVEAVVVVVDVEAGEVVVVVDVEAGEG